MVLLENNGLANVSTKCRIKCGRRLKSNKVVNYLNRGEVCFRLVYVGVAPPNSNSKPSTLWRCFPQISVVPVSNFTLLETFDFFGFFCR
ncbi:hypothetical protein Hanom_Chr08g00752581 [Helianthus anomalus]